MALLVSFSLLVASCTVIDYETPSLFVFERIDFKRMDWGE